MVTATQEPHAPLFTLSDVLELEHCAWQDSDGDAFLFDGIMLWRTRDGRQSAVQPEGAPLDGWWHRLLCTARRIARRSSTSRSRWVRLCRTAVVIASSMARTMSSMARASTRCAWR
jgi:hypothetical protein